MTLNPDEVQEAIESSADTYRGDIPKKLYKTTIVIWSEYDCSEVELHDLAFQAEEGDAYCSSQKSVVMTREQIENDPDWDDTEFFESSLDNDEDGDDDYDDHE